jgi:hypothetical protein
MGRACTDMLCIVSYPLPVRAIGCALQGVRYRVHVLGVGHRTLVGKHRLEKERCTDPPGRSTRATSASSCRGWVK